MKQGNKPQPDSADLELVHSLVPSFDAFSLKLETTGVTSQIEPLRKPLGKWLPHPGQTRGPGSGRSGEKRGPWMEGGELWAAKTVHKMGIAAKLREGGMLAEAEILEGCHTQQTYAECQGCRRVSVFLNRCDRNYCPECAPKLGRLRRESVEWWCNEIPQPKHVVLTVRNRQALTREWLVGLKGALSKLRRRKFARNWVGGFYALEITNEGRGWHVHFHLLINARYIDSQQLAIKWAELVGQDMAIVKVKDCRREDYVRELTKYLVKGSQVATWPRNEVCDFVRAINGLRTFGVFGCLYGKRSQFSEWLKTIKKYAPRCECGCESIKYFSANEWAALGCVGPGPLEPRPPPCGQIQVQFAHLTPGLSHYVGGF